MKNIIGLFSLVAVFTAMSCTDQTKETKKEVIVVPAPAPAPAPAPVIIVKDPPATSISIDKNGVKVETKNVKVNLEKQQ